ncbi:zinc-dependent metalloprotease [Fusarium beomiforme]|uniref:Zinc-dependent metalloprotease n=1 Tax=Fusarium beomiforme TaxID=44412 RepID=A0A9P5DTT3_9HYPO|nr:zinc-dependent metalloprotease [Fusarium beomiforme]
MRPIIFLPVLPLFATYVQAGSQLWETAALTPKSRGDTLLKRAVSIFPSDDERENAGAYRWPEKTITYAFNNAQAEEKMEEYLEKAMNDHWNRLKVDGFKYKKLDLSKFRARRSECMIIYYNDEGNLATSVGLRAIEQGYEGPYMHLSDRKDVGNLDVAANVAHELGHVWGLWHEHQARRWWGLSDITESEKWGGFLTGEIFMTGDYHPENLKDYEEALERMAKAKGHKSKDELSEEDVKKLYQDHETAVDYGFSGKDWMPIVKKGGMDADDNFDENSLMLYPRGSGGKGEVEVAPDPKDSKDGRLPVLVRANLCLSNFTLRYIISTS